MGYVCKAFRRHHDYGDRDCKDGDDQVPHFRWITGYCGSTGWGCEFHRGPGVGASRGGGSSMGGRGKGVPQAINLGGRDLCYSHCKAHIICSVFTQAMFVERLAMRCPPCGGSVMESALGVHPSPDSTGRAPTPSSVLQPEMTPPSYRQSPDQHLPRGLIEPQGGLGNAEGRGGQSLPGEGRAQVC